MDAFQVVRDGYDRIGTRYRDASRENPIRMQWVEWLLDELAPGSLVLELGCGAGEPATRLLADHHRVVGVDASFVQLRLARSAAPGAALVQADMTRLGVRSESVDAVTSFYAFGHVPQADHVPLLRSIAAWLRPNGWLLANLPVQAGDARSESWLGVPMFFGGIAPPLARQTIEEASLVIDQWSIVPEMESDGRTVEFAWLVARKLASASP
ncbi:MAG TPA: class I SAM-dependent methyltransferase [Frankiaceae bacterium]|jgi:cyclopropane fatty-acyl-phospholipid synthase-like methyltransferase|nr:class I SAM-dependent methyltransferase [Frankiaceae bacterium]